MTESRLFSEWEVYEELDQLGDPLEQLKQLVDFERFRPILEECWCHEGAGQMAPKGSACAVDEETWEGSLRLQEPCECRHRTQDHSGYVATPANDHDVTVVDALIDGRQREGPFYGDAAYRSQEVEAMLRAQGLTSRIMFKRGKHRSLTAYQRRENRRRAKVRVEHVLASCQNELGGKFIRTIGLDRASVQIGLQNLLYNMHRLVFLAREAMV